MLYIWNNQITSLEPLSYCINLCTLCCNNNQITTLEPLSHCLNLQDLYCSHNQIITLEPLSYCSKLHTLDFRNNQITRLEPLLFLAHLRFLDLEENPLNAQIAVIQILLNRMDANIKSYDDNYKKNSQNHQSKYRLGLYPISSQMSHYFLWIM